MVSETITISDKGGRERFGVDVDMIFKNHGPDTTLQLGFPILMDEVDGERVEFDPHFRTWVKAFIAFIGSGLLSCHLAFSDYSFVWNDMKVDPIARNRR